VLGGAWHHHGRFVAVPQGTGPPVVPEVPHQICVFHVLKEITKAVLHALAKLRKELAAQIPKLPPARRAGGRPRQGKESKAKTRRVKRLKQRLALLSSTATCSCVGT